MKSSIKTRRKITMIDIQMTNKLHEIMQRPDVIRGFKIKTVMNYHYIPNRILEQN